MRERRLSVLTLSISWYCSSPIPTLISMRWQPTFTTRGGGCTQVNKSPSTSRSWISRRRLLQSRPIRPKQRRCSIASFASGTELPPLASFRCPGGCSLMLTSFGVTIERCNRKKGWALKLFRVRKDGHYGHGQKLTVLFAIEPGDPTLPTNVYGSVEHPRRWIRCVRNFGTSNNTFQDFC